jgi:transcriptional regulator with XRE-family HTH domain
VPLDPLPDWVEPARRAVGLRIAVLRRRAGLSQERLAERAFLERKAINRYETGVRTPTVVELLLIADALGVPVSSLFADPHEE